MSSYAHGTYTKTYGRHGFRTDPDREIVVLINVLSGSDVNHGYESFSYKWKELVTFNGETVLSLAGLYAAWQRAASAEFLEFCFGDAETAWYRKIVLDGALVRESEEHLLALHGIPARASMGVLNQTHRVALHAANGATLPPVHP
uniref:Protease Do-like PDZ domain-containing protein n=1 Tax=Haptolina ericina TaxID=156174 RepID=A0A7S3AGK5_9EUKA|mmetsp:Transcript_13794/g.31221  ORF Transcript_13794/g.31221 Transcript_13794/m.31221 type:complete len:145 (+) Transcript_13794:518-952(+)